jgi:hypothetical protein
MQVNYQKLLPSWPTRLNAERVLLYALYIAVAIGSLYRIFHVFEFNPLDHIFSDPERHWEQGTEVVRTDPMPLTDPVLYQIYIGALAKLSLQIPSLVAFYTALLSLLMPWAWYRFFRELQPSKLAAVTGWAVITWLPSWNGIYSFFMQETLMLPLLGGALWATWRCQRKRTLQSFLLSAVSANARCTRSCSWWSYGRSPASRARRWSRWPSWRRCGFGSGFRNG